MAKASKARIAKRAASKSEKISGRAGNAKVVEATKIVERKIVWNVNAPKVKAVIDFAVAQGTSVATAGTIGMVSRTWAAIEGGQCASAHASNVLNAIEAATHAALKDAKLRKGSFKVASASRVSEFKTIMELAAFKCTDDLVKVLSRIDALTISGMYAVALWMRGPRGKNGEWNATSKSAPPLKKLLTIVHGANKRVAKDPNGTRSVATAIKSGKIIGFPSKDTREGAKFLARAVKVFIKANPEMNASEKTLALGMIKTADTLADSVAKRIKAARVAKTADAK